MPMGIRRLLLDDERRDRKTELATDTLRDSRLAFGTWNRG